MKKTIKYSVEFKRKNKNNLQLLKTKKECKFIVEFYEWKIRGV